MARSSAGWLSWLMVVTGWLVCAAMAGALSIALEAKPDAYELFLPALVGILFLNFPIYFFVGNSLLHFPQRLARAVALVCLSEVVIFGLMFLLGWYAVG